MLKMCVWGEGWYELKSAFKTYKALVQMFAFMLVTITLIAVFVRTLVGLPVASPGLREPKGWSPRPPSLVLHLVNNKIPSFPARSAGPMETKPKYDTFNYCLYTTPQSFLTAASVILTERSGNPPPHPEKYKGSLAAFLTHRADGSV